MVCSFEQIREKGGLEKMDSVLKGLRCRTTREVRSHRALIEKSTAGTIRHEIENLGRRLINVQWDSGATDYVFPSEIEIIDEEESSTGVNS
jgi:hypothetical protein